MKRAILLALICLPISLWLLFASDPGTGDWPMWGGTPDRNMVSIMKGIPTTWDVKTKKNVKWMAQLGSQSYGNPVVAGGQVYVGTNNELVRNPKERGDRGVLMCFRESDGKFLWQQANVKLAAGRAQRLALPGRVLLAAGGRRPAVLRHQPLRSRVPRYARRRQRRAEGDLEVRHDGRSRIVAAQHVEFVAGFLRRPDFREHGQRAG